MFRPLLISFLLATPLAADEVQILPGYSDFRAPPAQVTDLPMALVQDLVLNFPGEGGGLPRLDLSAAVKDGQLIIEFTEDGLADDSTRAFQRRFEFTRTEDWRWQLTGYGHRQRCWRGTVDVWTDKPCP
ncbi:hypothetical protein [Mameliella sediminis]|uniref:hypothetical protein n=1 Tax=Mameliella sediminis TaxID=2836866 RepID=UPI001C44567C|nr:hypothetical protein [Mameliella sediminis]MBY6114185.1 hypothetical protein [Antarctobacter heliothermus]MBY6142467.1 hypothetical protein [Mameliella alba]MBV7395482.1 hypothetical protein [Mameliella sediminis]MBY6159295.1 hypothetical protein [Mameliella alba]MBY6167766.1 hypothetical protein [Mameliella alba]